MVVKYKETDKNTKSSRIIERWISDDALMHYALLEAHDPKENT